MTTQINDGGAAFPKPGAVDANGNICDYSEPGMSLRDWLAGLALQGMLSNHRIYEDAERKGWIVEGAVIYADLLIAQLRNPS